MGLHERFDSRSRHVEEADIFRTTVDLKYTVDGTEDDQVVDNTIRSGTPARFRGLYRQTWDMDHKGGGVWDVTVRYGLVDLNDSEFSFDTTGATGNLQVSLETRHRIGNAPDLKGLINWDGEQVKGVDVQIPAYAWQESHTIPPENFTPTYKALLSLYTPSSNDGAWRGFQKGEVKFRGVTGSQRGDHPVRVTYYFEASPNLTSFTYAGETVPDMYGMADYVWASIKHIKDEATNRVIPYPDGVYVDRILEFRNLRNLGIGT